MSESKTSSLDGVQFGGDHYKGMGIEPAEFAHSNSLGFLEGSAIKYLARHKLKNKAEDMKKALHYCAMVLDMEYGIETKFTFEEKAKDVQV